MYRRKLGVLTSLIIVIAIYIVFSIIGGAFGELILHLNLLNTDFFRRGVVSFFLLLFLYFFDLENAFNNQNIRWGFISVLITICLTLIINNEFSYLSFRFSYIYIALMAGASEEVLFRGILFYFVDYFHLKEDRKTVLKIYVSTIVFSLAHLYNIISINQNVTQTLIQMIYALCLGSVFAICYVNTKNIFFSIFAHSISVLLSEVIGKSGLTTNISLNSNNFILIVVLVVITIFVNYFGLKIIKDD